MCSCALCSTSGLLLCPALIIHTVSLHPAQGNALATLRCAFTNYRAWVLLLTYGYSFGVELTVDNIIVQYLYDQFEMDHVTAGGLGSLFGLMNVFTRATGGILSDVVAVRYGMRGRLWTLWIIQTLGGAFCIAMGYCNNSLAGTLATMIIFSIFCQQVRGGGGLLGSGDCLQASLHPNSLPLP